MQNVGVIPLLGLLFVGLRLGRIIDWPWLWVLAPFWGLFAFCVCLCVVAAALRVCRSNGRRPGGWR